MIKVKSTEDRFRGYDCGPPIKCKEYLYGWFPPLFDVYQRCQQKYTPYEVQCLYNHSNSRYIDHSKGTRTPQLPAHLVDNPTDEDACYDNDTSQRLLQSVTDLILRVDAKTPGLSGSRPESRRSISASESTSININSSSTKVLNKSRPKTALSCVSRSTSEASTSKPTLRPKSVPVTAMSTRSKLSESVSKSRNSVSGQKSRASVCRYPHMTWSTDAYATEVEIVMSPPMSPTAIRASKDKVNDYLSRVSDTLGSIDDASERSISRVSRKSSIQKNNLLNSKVYSKPEPVLNNSPATNQPYTGDNKASLVNTPLENSDIIQPPKPAVESTDGKQNSINHASHTSKSLHSKSQSSLLKSPSKYSLKSASMSLLLTSPIPCDDFSVFTRKSATPTVRSLLLEKPADSELGRIRRQAYKPQASQYTAYQPSYNNKTQDLNWKMCK